MSILIRGMEMPGKSICVEIFADGSVHEFADPRVIGIASSVPPHGRLGDLDELYSRLEGWYQTHKRAFTEFEARYIHAMLAGVKETPTIIPAEEGE